MAENKYILFKIMLLETYPMCEICGVRHSVEVNHCLYHRHGGIFDSFENCQAVCHLCHMTIAHTRLAKIAHWEKRVMEGYNMTQWNEKIPKMRKEGWN